MTKKVRVLQIIDQLGDAGAEKLLLTFVSGIDRERFEPHVCALRPWDKPNIVPALRALGVPTTELDQHHAYDLDVLRWLTDYIRREKIDIIHTHLLASDFLGRLAGLITRRPVVSTIHNGRIDLEKDPPHQQLMERVTAHLWCRKLIVVSELLRDEIIDWFHISPRKVVTVTNGIDTALYKPSATFDVVAMRQDLLGGQYRMVTNVARFTTQKAQHFLIEAAVHVVATRPDVRFVMVGMGPLQDELTQLADSKGIADKVIFAGLRKDVPEILAASDIFVLSSLWEGMPLSLLEAMAAGVPVVATEVGGVSQVLQNGVTGLMVPPADAAALAAAIGEALDNPAEARKRAATAEKMIEQKYDMKVMQRKLEAIYLRELKRK